MPLTATELERGLAYWRTTSWPLDFHNASYKSMAEANPHGAFDDAWWAGFLPVLRAWIATRPKSSAFLTPRAQERFAAPRRVWTQCVEPRLGGDIANVEWRDEVPLADGEGGALGMYSREDVIPPPPPGYAGRTLPRSVAAQEASAVAASGIHVATGGGF